MAGVLRTIALIAGALLLAASWLDERAFAAAWLGMAMFFMTVARLSRRTAFAAGFLYGLVLLITAFHWAPHMLAITLDCDGQLWTPWLVFLAIVAWEAVPLAVIGSATAASAQRVIPLWAVAGGWIVMERFWPRVFPWSLGHTQVGFRAMVQVAELGGVFLVSFILVYACLDIGLRISRKDLLPRLATCGPLLLVAANLAFGSIRLASLDASLAKQETTRVGVVQIDPSYTDAMKKMRAASERMPPIDLLLWPESTLGTYSSAVGALSDIRQDVDIAHMPFLDWKQAQGLVAWLLAGGKAFEPGAGDEGPYFQAAYLIDTSGVFRGRYYKRVLMPIGEYMPLEKMYPGLHEWAQLSEYIDTGTNDAPLLAAGGEKIGVMLCYEDIVADVSRRSVKQGAEILVSLINGTAFEDALALEQHLRLATLRTIENRRTLIRCAGTGISCCIEPTGKVVARLPANEEGEFTVEARLNQGRTIYNRFGYLFPHAVAAALGILALSAYRR